MNTAAWYLISWNVCQLECVSEASTCSDNPRLYADNLPEHTCRAACQDFMMTARNGTTVRAEGTARIVMFEKHRDSKVHQQGIAVTDPW